MSSSRKIAQVVFGNKDFFMSVSLDKWLKERGKIFGDIIGAILLVKSNPSDTDEEALMTKTVGSGLTASGTDYIVETESTDFGVGKLVSGKTYGMYFGVKLTGETSYREIILKVPTLKVLSDGIRG